MSIKFSQLTQIGTVNGVDIIPIVDLTGSSPVSNKVTVSQLQSFIVTPATSSALGSVIVPTSTGLKVDVSGNISISNLIHAFTVDSSGNLQYSQISDTNATLQSGGVDLYATWELGNNQYSYSIDSNGNLLVTFAS